MIHQARIDEARYLLELLGNIARVTFFRADDTCHHVEADEYTVPVEAVDDIEKALSACDHLPEPEEGVVSEGYCRALRRLQQLLSEFETREEQVAELENQTAQLSARLVESDVERDKLAAHAKSLDSAGHALYYELEQWSLTESDPETRAAMKLWRLARGEEPSNALARLKAEWQEKAYSEAAMKCRGIEAGQEKLAWMHSEVAEDGEKYVGENGIPYSNKALGAQHCAREMESMARRLRRQTEQAEDGQGGAA
ncbi:hypothetical protein [Halomonas sp. SL1]|uniref:hypothetical protein n=1 Tax=Halomonas sp. SL1 TaxID=2137478 RepID=UPI000D15979A|nr:hypothetical protein [Halomonas sp. SL1]RAH37442.1 hypothetical protein C9J49_011105 [Halomonas sp. SL1]